ncbi:MAG: alpha/beta hydrolase [Vulcanimicrobiota bacterium]
MDTVLMLHSGGLTGRQWRRVASFLEGYRLLTPDFLGCGQNPPWPAEQEFHFELDLAALEPLLDRPLHLVGHSYGGFLALQLARRHPELGLSLSLYDPVAFGVLHSTADPEGLADLERVASQPLFGDLERGGGPEWLELFVDYWNGPGGWQAMAEPARQAFLEVGRKVFFEVRSLSADRTGLADYANLTMPVLLMTGEQTPASARRVCALLADSLPRARHLVIEGAGHMGPITHAEAVGRAIASQLSG